MRVRTNGAEQVIWFSKEPGKMTSRRESVVLQGILRGEGHERSCRVRAIKVAMPCEPMASEYADMDIAILTTFLMAAMK